MPPNKDKTTGNMNNKAYVVFTNDNKANVVNISAARRDLGVIKHRTVGSSSDPLSDLHTRAPYNRLDYDAVRPDERIPRKFRDVIHACRAAYLRVGIVRNVIDMMTDFTTEDLKIVHPDKKVEAFFRVWMKKVNLREAVDEFVRHFLVDGNVVVKRITARLSKPVEEQWAEEKTVGADEKLYIETKVPKREIPWRYSFLNVAALTWLGGEEAQIAGKKRLAFRVSKNIAEMIRTPNDDFQKGIVSRLPESLVKNIKTNSGDWVELDMDTVYVSHNKKDTWEDWAPPFLYSVLSEIYFRDKLRQAEVSALDGVINVIRLWKLGDHENGFLPNQAIIDKLIDILQANTGGGAMDLVWDSLIDMQEYYPPVDKILGSEKYEQVNRDILIGLGVPEVLIGGQGSNFSNSWIQLRTLVEKLEYIRQAVIDWLNIELRYVCNAMDIKIVPKIRFNNMNLEDENVTRKLILDLLDRGVISVEAVHDVYGEDFLMEVERMKYEKQLFKSAGIKPKSPLDPKPVKPGGAKPPTGRKGAGRPKKSVDTSTRKTRKAKPRRSAGSELTIFALDAIDAIDQNIIPVYMENLGVASARKLTNDQKEELSNVRMSVLACIKPNDKLDRDSLITIAEKCDQFDPEIVTYIEKSILKFISDNGVEPTVTQRKRLEAVAWAKFHEMGDDNQEGI